MLPGWMVCLVEFDSLNHQPKLFTGITLMQTNQNRLQIPRDKRMKTDVKLLTNC